MKRFLARGRRHARRSQRQHSEKPLAEDRNSEHAGADDHRKKKPSGGGNTSQEEEDVIIEAVRQKRIELRKLEEALIGNEAALHKELKNAMESNDVSVIVESSKKTGLYKKRMRVYLQEHRAKQKEMDTLEDAAFMLSSRRAFSLFMSPVSKTRQEQNEDPELHDIVEADPELSNVLGESETDDFNNIVTQFVGKWKEVGQRQEGLESLKRQHQEALQKRAELDDESEKVRLLGKVKLYERQIAAQSETLNECERHLETFTRDLQLAVYHVNGTSHGAPVDHVDYIKELEALEAELKVEPEKSKSGKAGFRMRLGEEEGQQGNEDEPSGPRAYVLQRLLELAKICETHREGQRSTFDRLEEERELFRAVAEDDLAIDECVSRVEHLMMDTDVLYYRMKGSIGQIDTLCHAVMKGLGKRAPRLGILWSADNPNREERLWDFFRGNIQYFQIARDKLSAVRQAMAVVVDFFEFAVETESNFVTFVENAPLMNRLVSVRDQRRRMLTHYYRELESRDLRLYNVERRAANILRVSSEVEVEDLLNQETLEDISTLELESNSSREIEEVFDSKKAEWKNEDVRPDLEKAIDTRKSSFQESTNGARRLERWPCVNSTAGKIDNELKAEHVSSSPGRALATRRLRARENKYLTQQMMLEAFFLREVVEDHRYSNLRDKYLEDTSTLSSTYTQSTATQHGSGAEDVCKAWRLQIKRVEEHLTYLRFLKLRPQTIKLGEAKDDEDGFTLQERFHLSELTDLLNSFRRDLRSFVDKLEHLALRMWLSAKKDGFRASLKTFHANTALLSDRDDLNRDRAENEMQTDLAKRRREIISLKNAMTESSSRIRILTSRGTSDSLAAEQFSRDSFKFNMLRAQYDILDAISMRRSGHLQVLYRNHIHQSPLVSPRALMSALDQYSPSTFRDVLFAHKLASFLVAMKTPFESPFDNLEQLQMFLMEKLYGRLIHIALTDGQKLVLRDMLLRAYELGLLSSDNVSSFRLVHQLATQVEDRFRELTNVLEDIYQDFGGRLTVVEQQLFSIETALLRMKEAQKDAKRAAMIAAVVKLGLSFIPIAGQICSAAVEAAAQGAEILTDTLLTETPEEMLQAVQDILLSGADTGIDMLAMQDVPLTHSQKQNIAAANLGRVALSAQFRERMPERHRQKLVSTVESTWGSSINEVENEVDKIVKSFIAVRSPTAFDVDKLELYGRYSWVTVDVKQSDGGFAAAELTKKSHSVDDAGITVQQADLSDFTSSVAQGLAYEDAGSARPTTPKGIDSGEPGAIVETEEIVTRSVSLVRRFTHDDARWALGGDGVEANGRLGLAEEETYRETQKTPVPKSEEEERAEQHKRPHGRAVKAMKSTFSSKELEWADKHLIERELIRTDTDGTYFVNREQFLKARREIIKVIMTRVTLVRDANRTQAPWIRKFLRATTASSRKATVGLSCRLVQDLMAESAPAEDRLESLFEKHSKDEEVSLAQFAVVLNILGHV